MVFSVFVYYNAYYNLDYNLNYNFNYTAVARAVVSSHGMVVRKYVVAHTYTHQCAILNSFKPR